MDTTNTAPNPAAHWKRGDRVICNGYCGTISAVVDWTDGMVEVRLPGGEVCVDVSAVRAATTDEIKKAARNSRVYIGQ